MKLPIILILMALVASWPIDKNVGFTLTKQTPFHTVNFMGALGQPAKYVEIENTETDAAYKVLITRPGGGYSEIVVNPMQTRGFNMDVTSVNITSVIKSHDGKYPIPDAMHSTISNHFIEDGEQFRGRIYGRRS